MTTILQAWIDHKTGELSMSFAVIDLDIVGIVGRKKQRDYLFPGKHMTIRVISTDEITRKDALFVATAYARGAYRTYSLIDFSYV